MTRTFGSIPFIPLAAFALTTIFAPSWLSAQPQLLTPSAGSPIAVGNRPTGVATGDFNGDGKMDIAVADTSDSRVTVLLGDNAGGFTEAAGSPFFGGANPQVVIARDFNHDGKLDIASLNIGSYTISVLLGDGHGGFTLAPNPAAVSSPGGYMATGEFNGDNYPDLVVTDYGGANVLVFLGDGSGGFTAAPGSPISLGFGLEPTGVVTGDFNKDGKQDIAVAQSYDGHIAILTGDGTGAFTVQGIRPAGAQFPGTAGIGALAVGSFYNNGDLDLLVAGTNSNQVALLKGDGAADFSYQRQMTAYQRPLGIAVGDFDADGNQDVAAIAGNTSYLDIFPGNGAGNFNTATGPAYQTGTGPDGIATADFNNDGRPDIVVANNLDNTITVFLTNGPQLPPAPPSPPAPVVTQTPQTISFTVGNHLGSDAPFMLTATASSGLPVTFQVISGPATISGNTLTLTGVGTVVVRASQDGSYLWLPAAVQQSFTVALGAPSIRSIVNGASLAAGVIPAGSFATIFGSNFASESANGDVTASRMLEGASITILDSAKQNFTATIWRVSFGQANIVTPDGLAAGPAAVTLTNATGQSATFQITVGAVFPGLFSVDGSGSGFAAGSALMIAKDGTQTYQLTAALTPFGPMPVPVSFAPDTTVYLLLSGTGIRGGSSLQAVSLTVNGAPVPVTFAGAQGDYPGLDQIDALLPASLAKAGTVDVQLTVDGVNTNTVKLKFE